NTNPITIIMMPPAVIMTPECLTIHRVEPIKKLNMINGKEKPMTYITVYNIPCPGLLADNKRMEPKIGSIHGVHPAANPNPTNKVPKYPADFFEYLYRFSLIMIDMLIQPATKSPITIIKIPAILCS